ACPASAAAGAWMCRWFPHNDTNGTSTSPVMQITATSAQRGRERARPPADNSNKRAALGGAGLSGCGCQQQARRARRVARGAGGRDVADARQLIFGENLPTFGANFLYGVIA